MIYQGDAEHGPPHVHAYREGGVVVVTLDTVALRESEGVKRSVERSAVRLVEDHLDFLRAEWERING
jgi:hypothetical protein